MVREAREGSSEPLRLGSVFGMSMKKGLSYSMVSEVIEFELALADLATFEEAGVSDRE